MDVEVCPSTRKESWSTVSTGTMSSTSALFSILSALAGTALAVPYGFCLVGTGISLVSLTFVALINAYAVRCVALAMESTECLQIAERENVAAHDRELSFLAYVAFQERGRIIISILLAMELWCALLVSFVSICMHGSLLSGGWLSQSWVVVVNAVVLFPLLEGPSWLLGGAGVISILGVAICAGSLFVTAFSTSADTNPPAGGFMGIVSATGIFFYNYGNAAALPPIRNEMAAPRSFVPVSMIAIIVSLTFYAAVGVAGGRFGAAIGQSYLENVTNPWLLGFSCLAVVVSMFLVMPLLTKAILAVAYKSRCLQDQGQPVRKVIFKVTFLIVSALMAIFLQDALAAISALTGASLTMFTCVLAPVAIYSKLCPTSSRERLLLYALIAFGLVFAVVGTYGAMHDVLNPSSH